MFPIFILVGLMIADAVHLVVVKSRLEQAAGTLSITLAAQTSLTSEGLDALVANAASEDTLGTYGLLISNVMQTGRVAWQLQRGSEDAICPESEGEDGYYTGTLPEADPDEGNDSTISMIAVQLCQRSSDISMFGGLSIAGTLQAEAINRVFMSTVDLDDLLAEEAGLEDDDEDSDDD